MNANANIIDVTPIEHSSARAQAGSSKSSFGAQGGSASESRQKPGWRSSSHPGERSGGRFGKRSSSARADSAYGSTQTGFQGSRSETSRKGAWSPFSVLGGVAQVALGIGLIGIGVPMLILPGPGLLSIAAGGLLVARGLGKIVR